LAYGAPDSTLFFFLSLSFLHRDLPPFTENFEQARLELNPPSAFFKLSRTRTLLFFLPKLNLFATGEFIF